MLDQISKEEFIKSYCEKSNETWEELQKTHYVMPCTCEYYGCQGWQMASKQKDFLPGEFPFESSK